MVWKGGLPQLVELPLERGTRHSCNSRTQRVRDSGRPQIKDSVRTLISSTMSHLLPLPLPPASQARDFLAVLLGLTPQAYAVATLRGLTMQLPPPSRGPVNEQRAGQRTSGAEWLKTKSAIQCVTTMILEEAA